MKRRLLDSSNAMPCAVHTSRVKSATKRMTFLLLGVITCFAAVATADAVITHKQQLRREGETATLDLATREQTKRQLQNTTGSTSAPASSSPTKSPTVSSALATSVPTLSVPVSGNCSSLRDAYETCLRDRLIPEQGSHCDECTVGALPYVPQPCVNLGSIICQNPTMCGCSVCTDAITAWMKCYSGCAAATAIDCSIYQNCAAAGASCQTKGPVCCRGYTCSSNNVCVKGTRPSRCKGNKLKCKKGKECCTNICRKNKCSAS